METWALNAMQRWPNVPALFGWLSLDRRGRWLIKGEPISRPQIIDTINANYEVDEYGRWYFQNGPQRGYMQLAYAPLVVHVDHDALVTHTQQRVERLGALYLDEEGSLLLMTEHGPAGLVDTDLEWALDCMRHEHAHLRTEDLATALAAPSGQATTLSFNWQGQSLPIARLDNAAQPDLLKFVREPQPRPNERVATATQD